MKRHEEWLQLQQCLASSKAVKMHRNEEDNVERHGRKIIEESTWVSPRSCTTEATEALGDDTMTEKRTVKINGEEFEVEMTLNDDGSYDATVEGQTFTIEIPNAQAAPRARRGGGSKKKKSGTVSANIPGKVVTVEVNEGDVVKEGQVILILEAMKMQNEIQAPIDGAVISVACEEGQAIEANVPLVVIEPEPTQDED